MLPCGVCFSLMLIIVTLSQKRCVNLFVTYLFFTLPSHQRDNVVAAFREGKIWVLICTELMSRGVDFKGVNLVINYDFPPSAISYIHRVGRTGRAGRQGKSVTFWTMEDRPRLRR